MAIGLTLGLSLAGNTVGESVPDTVDPTISSSVPADNAIDIAVDAEIAITFSEPIQFGTGNIILREDNGGWGDVETFTLPGAIGSGPGTVSISGNVLTIRPTSDMANSREHAIRMWTTAIDDLAGNSFAGIANDTTLSWTTVAAPGDTTDPVWNSSSYNDGTKTITANITEVNPNRIYWVGVANPSAPSVAQILAGTGGGILEAGNYTYADGANSDTISITNTSIDEIHLVATDVAGNDSAIEIITGVTVPAPSTYPTIAQLGVDYDSDATSQATHTTGNFTPDGSKDLLVFIWTRNDNNATGTGALSALTLNGSSITSNIVQALRFSGYTTGNGRSCMIAARIPAASVSAVSQNVSVTFGDSHRNVRIRVYEVTGGGAIGASDITANTASTLTSTVDLTTTANNSLVLYTFNSEGAATTTMDHTELLNSGESSIQQAMSSEEVAASATVANESFVKASASNRGGSIAIEVLAA